MRTIDLANEYHSKEAGTLPYLKYKLQIMHCLSLFLKPNFKHSYLEMRVEPVRRMNLCWVYAAVKLYQIPEPVFDEILEELNCEIIKPTGWSFYWQIQTPADLEINLEPIMEAIRVAGGEVPQLVEPANLTRRKYDIGSGLD